MILDGVEGLGHWGQEVVIDWPLETLNIDTIMTVCLNRKGQHHTKHTGECMTEMMRKDK